MPTSEPKRSIPEVKRKYKTAPVTLKNFMIQYRREDLLPFVGLMVLIEKPFQHFIRSLKIFFLNIKESL